MKGHGCRTGRRWGLGILAWALGGTLVIVVPPSSARAQEGNRITGKVEDGTEHGPVPAATVLITGTTIGINTSDSGTFTLRLPTDAKSMIVRRIGYLAQTVALTPGKTEYTILLQRDVLRLETQVVTGLATSVASQNSANAVSVVSTQDINLVPAPTMENSIQGKIPGAVIQGNNGGAPGGGLQIQVRGVTSIYGNGTPLYVVDGVIVDNETVNADENAINNSGGGISSTGSSASGAPSVQDNGVNRIADINPDDIESLEVLKGASASAIYGSKASAGVVVITTKRGTSGKARWDISNQVGHYAISHEYPIRTFNSLGLAQAWYNNDIVGTSNPSTIASDNAFIQSVYGGPQDYQTQLFGNGQASYQTNISVSGSAGQTQYYVSGLSKYDNGSLLNTGYNKQSFRANLTQQFLSAVTVTANINYIHDVARRGITGNDNIGISPYDVFSYTPGFVNLQQQTAAGTWPDNPFGPANPFANANEISTPQQTSRTMGGGSINWTPWKTDHQSLQLTAVGGMDLTSFSALLYAPPDLQVEQREPSGLPGTSVSNTDQINYFNYQLNLIHHYTGLSWLDATTSIGFERDRRTNTEPVNVGYNLLSGVNAPSAGTVQNSFFYNTKELDQSFYAQEQALLFNQRLTVTGGVTAERSTNDGNINRFYYYPHYSAAFRLPGMPSFLDEVKVRAAYGQSGNLAPYGSKYTPLPPSFIAGNAAFASNQLLGDPTIKPESEVETELGFDATMLHSRAQFSATVYQKRLSSLLLQAGVAPSFGYLYAYTNGGQFTNQGIELSLQATPLQMRNGFTWSTTVSEFRNYSRVDALPVPPFGACSGGWCYGSFFAVGRSVTELVNTSFTGPSGLPVQNGDASAGLLTELGNEFTFKGFRVHGLLDWSRGGNTSNSTDFYFDELGSHLAADSARSAVHQAQVALGLNPFNQPASFLKVREVTVSYALPARFVASIGGGRITNARLNLSGYNLWMITSYGGLDPEVSFAGNQAVRAAGEVTPYPPSRSVFLGLDLGF